MAIRRYNRNNRDARTGLYLVRLEDRVTPAYSATLSGSTSTWTGGSSGGTGDILSFGASGGLLTHNRFVAGDAGFASAFDFDSKTNGDQTLAALTASAVVVTTGKSTLDEVRIGGSNGVTTGPASELKAAFTVNPGSTGQTLRIDDADASDTAGDAFQVTTTEIISFFAQQPRIVVTRGGGVR